ncbi:tetratricopeptide repeat protein [Sphaerospermopsis aphanizomenoides BCCUSP55]|uniref:tetratricopeptide repeat protein n=1 Tax=Sphaerospermopsis aphanizomenoides TaxID=459663 RepID=UPI001904DF05|nr:tetratricopeptide repeat protein [Sphaerospermopsis aphanizomenoides]MBK1990143.1 tetratricopeptide repeat protein [Sphaerospermopsis aphanizomenoides BCCUSP55]
MLSPTVSLQKINSNTSAAEIWNAAKLNLKLGRVHQSLMIAYSAVQKDPNQQQMYNKYYIQVMRLGAEFSEEIEDHHKAAYYWEQFTKQIPNDGNAWYGLGIAKANLQDYQGAIIALNQAVKLQPENQKIRSMLIKIQQMLAG